MRGYLYKYSADALSFDEPILEVKDLCAVDNVPELTRNFPIRILTRVQGSKLPLRPGDQRSSFPKIRKVPEQKT